MKYFLDTNTCSYFLKGMYPQLARELLSHSPSDIFVPSIVKAELLYGAERSKRRKENLEKIRQFLQPFAIVPFENESADRYGPLRALLDKAGTPIGPNDLIVAATTLSNNGVLVTNNENEFRRVPKLKLENWTK